MESIAQFIGEVLATVIAVLFLGGIPISAKLSSLSSRRDEGDRLIADQAKTISELKDQVKKLREQVDELLAESARDKNHIDLLTKQVEELDTLRKRITELEAENLKFKDIEARYLELSKRYEGLLSKVSVISTQEIPTKENV